MSSTRYAKPGSPLNQSKFSSSEEFETGLLANLVARRCRLLESAEERELIWFLQLLSHREGGLEKVADEIAARFKDRIGSESMLRFGAKRGQVYNREQVRKVRLELGLSAEAFPLRGEITSAFYEAPEIDEWGSEKQADEENQRRCAEEERHPDSYPAEAFRKVCEELLGALGEALKELCLKPTRNLATVAPCYFADLPTCLREYHDEWIAARRAETVSTEIGGKLAAALDYSADARCLVLMEGQARTGKTFSSKAWCEQHPGRARYVQVPSSNDETGFYRAIAKAIGVASGTSMKAIQLRERVEEALQNGDLLLCLDEAHYCWPNSNYHHALPNRINWILTALVNHGVPVALVTTPQFIQTQKVVEKRTHWTSEQFIGRIGHYEKLPATLAEPDLEKVALALLPEGDGNSIEILVRYAQSSAKYLGGIEAVVKRARYLAKLDRRERVSRADIKSAIQESIIPSDSALAQSLTAPPKGTGKGSSRLLQTPLPGDADRLQTNADAPSISDTLSVRGTNRNPIDLTQSDRDLVRG